MKRLFFSLLAMCLATIAAAQQQAAGTWNGAIEVKGVRLRLIFHIAEGPEGWRAAMDSPDQGAKGLPIDSVVVTSSGVTLVAPQWGMVYRGAFVGADRIMGVLEQGGIALSLGLTRGEPVVNRPQEPRAPFPYRAEEVTFTGRDGAVTLHGTLSLPEGEGPFPAVVLVTGSGVQNRDEELMNHKPFLVLADHLTRRGVAVLRYDDRGFGASDEELSRLSGSTTADLAEDALGAFDLLLSRPEIDPARIGVAGHSEGGTIAFLCAAREPRVGFVVSLAGMIVPGAELLAEQNRALLMAMGIPEPTAGAYARVLKRIFATWRDRIPEDVATHGEEIVAAAAEGEELPEQLRANALQVVAGVTNPWLRYFVLCDPAEAVRALGGRPCLALGGSKDLQVNAAQNLGALRRLTEEASQVRIREYEGLNHLFQHCTTGMPAEYGQIEETMAPEVLDEIAVWIVGGPGRK